MNDEVNLTQQDYDDLPSAYDVEARKRGFSGSMFKSSIPNMVYVQSNAIGSMPGPASIDLKLIKVNIVKDEFDIEF